MPSGREGGEEDMDDSSDSREDTAPSTARIGLGSVLPRVLATIFVVECALMFALARLRLAEPWDSFADATALSLIAAPILYFWIVAPLGRRLQHHFEAERQAVAALSASEARQRVVVDTVPDAVLGVGSDGRILVANPAAERVFGHSRAELVGLELMALAVTGEKDWIVASRHAVVRHGEGRRVRAQRRDGAAFPAGLLVCESPGGDEPRFTVLVRDLTEVVEHEEEITRRVLQLEALQGLNELMLRRRSVDDLCAGAVGGAREALRADSAAVTILEPNGLPRFRAWEGFSDDVRQWIEQRGTLDFGLGADESFSTTDVANSALPASLRELFAHEGLVAIAVFPIQHDGQFLGRLTLGWREAHTLNAEDERLALAIASSIAIVVQRSQMEEHERRLALALDSSADAVVLTDRKGHVVRTNPAFSRITGWSADEIRGKSLSVLNSGVQGAEFYREMWATISRGESWAGRLVDVRKDGTRFHASLSIAPVLDEFGDVTAYVGIQRDVTLDMQREEALRLNAERLEEANRELVEARDRAEAAAKAKAEFLATMSHEIRTPMNGVLGFTHVLLDSKLDDDQRECVNTIRNSGQALLTIINDILDFSKIEAGRLELEHLPYDLPKTLQEITELMRPQAEAKGLFLLLDADPAVPTGFQGDPVRVRQVVLNLVGNAIKFTADGGVTVRLRRDDVSSRARIEIEDTGIGIPRDKLGNLFQLFTQVDASTTRRFGGTGLGLAISRRLAELMGGAVGVESEEGRGSIFWFDLPLPANTVLLPRPTGLAEVKPLARADGEQVRVLVAEDNSVNQKLAKRLLEKAGCDVEVVGDGQLAVEAVKEKSYHLVIMDCHMPNMDGFEATREIRRRFPRGSGPRIVALTASALKSDHEACIEAGMDDFLTKPIVPEKLHDCVHRWAA